MTIKSIYGEKRTHDGETVDSIRIALEPTAEELAGYIAALPEDLRGYNTVMEYNLTLYKPPAVRVRELEQDAAAKGERLRVLAMVLPDEIAVQHADLYPVWAVGTHTNVGERYQYDGGLYRVIQAHVTQDNWTPDISASLYSRLNAPNEHPAWTEGSWDKGAIVAHSGKVWESMVDHNVWEPGADGVGENIWREVL